MSNRKRPRPARADNRGVLAFAAAAIIAGGGYWYFQGDAVDGAEVSGQATLEAESGRTNLEKAVISGLLAATYSAERGARISQAETMLAGLPSDLSAAEKRDVAAIRAMLPENRQERDAGYTLYFRALTALSGASDNDVEAAMDAVEGELSAAGLQRLSRYISPVKAQVARVRENGAPSTEDREQWIEELMNAVLK